VRDSCHLRSLRGENYTTAVTQWLTALSRTEIPKFPGKELYKGQHWKLTTQALDAARTGGLESNLWVMSAGYGLISADHCLAPYSSTFSAGKDGIQNLSWPQDWNASDKARAWWNALNKHRDEIIPEFFGEPRSLVELFDKEGSDDALLIVIVSKEYFPAIEVELKELSAKTNNVLVLGAAVYGEAKSPQIQHIFASLSEKFKRVSSEMNVANVSLNAATALWLIKNHLTTLQEGVDSIHDLFRHYDRVTDPIKRPTPVKMTDEEVLSFIHSKFSSTASATQLLRMLRDVERKSCEQKRFGRLFKQYIQKAGSK